MSELNSTENENSQDKLEVESKAMLSADSELVDLDLPEDLEKVLFYAFDEASQKLEEGESIVPFTLTLAGEDLFMDEHDKEDTDECYASARDSVNLIAHLADSYVFCYDGYIDTDDGTHDMIICEVGEKNSPDATAYGLVYEVSEDENSIAYDEGLLSLGEVENLFDPERVKAAEEMQQMYEEAGVDPENPDAD